MSKRNKIIYWIATVWLCLGMATSGIMQVMNHTNEVTLFTHLGYPIYFMTIIGVWKLLGIVTLLIPKYPLLKEWAYAGFFFTMTGAVVSHIAMNDSAKEYFGPVLLIVLTIVSWYFRPANRKVIAS